MEIIKKLFSSKSAVDYTTLNFKPGQLVMCSSCDICLGIIHKATIIKWYSFQPAWIRPDGCNWFYIKYENGVIKKLPECVIQDYAEAKEIISNILKVHENDIGTPGNSLEDYFKLKKAIE